MKAWGAPGSWFVLNPFDWPLSLLWAWWLLKTRGQRRSSWAAIKTTFLKQFSACPVSPAAGPGLKPAACPGARELPGLSLLVYRMEGKDPCSRGITGPRWTVGFQVACTE